MMNVVIIVVVVGFGVIEWVNVVFGFIVIMIVVVVVIVANVFVVNVFVTAIIIPPVFSSSPKHTFTALILLSPTITIN